MEQITDVWQALVLLDAPVVMYGTGNGADKLLAVFAQRGIRCDGFFASDGFVRERTFHGLPVLSYEAARQTFGDGMTVVIGFASGRAEVMDRIRALRARHTVYMPPVPVIGSLTEQNGEGGIFDTEYYLRHRAQIEEACSLFLDETSKECYNNIINYRITGDISYLDACAHTPDDRYAVLGSERFTSCVDLGAYTGDTLREMMRYCPHLQSAIAAEPDPRTFAKLQSTADSLQISDIRLYEAAAWNCNTELPFAVRGNRGSGAGKAGKTRMIRALSPDTMIGDACPDYIKYDVEGAEKQAILGSIATIRRCRPALLVSLYHRTEDLYTLPLLIHRICPSYRFFLRRGNCYPDWEIQLLCTPSTE